MKISILPILAFAPLASASTLLTSLDFSQLPSSEAAWVYDATGNHADDGEATLFTVTGGELTQNTVGRGGAFSGSGSATYIRDFTAPEMADHKIFVLDVTLRYNQLETFQDNKRMFGHYYSLTFNGQNVSFGIAQTDEVQVTPFGETQTVSIKPAGFSTLVDHDYRLVLDTENSEYELFIDGASVATGTPGSFAGSRLRFGDGTGTNNASATVSNLRLTAGAIPEPSSLALLGFVLLPLLSRRR